MPPGNTRPRPTHRVLERHTAEACLAIAQSVQADCQAQGDQTGMAAALRIIESIRSDLIGADATPHWRPLPHGS